MKSPISVIITVYNDYEYLEQAISSVIAQELLPSEIIVIDDGSKEEKAETITKSFIKNDHNINILFFKKENGGASSARNLGLEKSSFNYIAFLDVDDRMLSNNLKDKYNVIKMLDDNYFGVYGGSIRSDNKEEIFTLFDGVVNTSLIDTQIYGIPGGSPFFLFNKVSLKNIQGFDENLKCNEDYDLIIRLFKDNKKCKGIASPGFYRNIRVDSLSRNINHMITFERIMKFLEKAEKLNYYEEWFLKQRKMETYMLKVKDMLLKKDFTQAFFYARKAFSYSKPITFKQKLLYIVSFSFLIKIK